MPLDNKYADVPLRIRSWGVIICVFAAAVSHPYAMCLFSLWVSFQALTELGGLFGFNPSYWRMAIPLLQGVLLWSCPNYSTYMVEACMVVGIGLILYLCLRQIPLGLPDFLTYEATRGGVVHLLGGNDRTQRHLPIPHWKALWQAQDLTQDKPQ